jgi:hypothetical protein
MTRIASAFGTFGTYCPLPMSFFLEAFAKKLRDGQAKKSWSSGPWFFLNLERYTFLKLTHGFFEDKN